MKFTPTDRLLLTLSTAWIVLLSSWVLLSARPQVSRELEAAASEPEPTLYIDVVVLAVAPEPSPTPEPDKPAYDPAVPLAKDLQIILREACEENGVELALALGVIEVEGRFVAMADNGSDYGLMQLNRRYFPAALSAGENIRAGAEYLGQLLTKYDTVEAALTACNAGYDTGARGYANAALTAAERWRGVV